VVCVGYSSEWWTYLSHNKLASVFMLATANSRPVLATARYEVDHTERQQVVVLYWLQPTANGPALVWHSKSQLQQIHCAAVSLLAAANGGSVSHSKYLSSNPV